MIANEAFFGWIEEQVDALVALDPAALAYAVKRSALQESKALVVAQDERESGLRAILNWPHLRSRHRGRFGFRRVAAW